MEPILSGADGKLFKLVGVGQDIGARVKLVDAPEASPTIHFWTFGGLSPLGCPAAGSGSDYVSGAVEYVTCSDCQASICKAASGSHPAPSERERTALVSMRDELLANGHGYWYDDPAISYIERICGLPAMTLEGLDALQRREATHEHMPQASTSAEAAAASDAQLLAAYIGGANDANDGVKCKRETFDKWRDLHRVDLGTTSPRLSIREFTQMESFLGWMLMTTISKDDKASKAKFERILASAHDGTGDERTPRYKVEAHHQRGVLRPASVRTTTRGSARQVHRERSWKDRPREARQRFLRDRRATPRHGERAGDRYATESRRDAGVRSLEERRLIMMIANGDGTYIGGPLDVLMILHHMSANTFHAAFFEEAPMPGPVEDVKDVRTVRLRSKMHHTIGASTLDEARAHLAEIAQKIQVADSNIWRDHSPYPWNGELGIVVFVENWLTPDGSRR